MRAPCETLERRARSEEEGTQDAEKDLQERPQLSAQAAKDPEGHKASCPVL